LALLDAALKRPEAMLIPIQLNTARMQLLHADGMAVPALLRGLLRPGLRKVSAASGTAAALWQRLAALPEAERKDAMLGVVREEVAVVLGAASAESIPPVRSLKELGLDSLMAVELRNRLSARSEVQLPATLAFDYPTPERIAGLLSEKLQLSGSLKSRWSDDEIRRKLSRISVEALARSGLLNDLMQCPDQPQSSNADASSDEMRELINSASDASLLDLADQILVTKLEGT
jgi:acyl carrier protein